jgi:hypothetical protein
MFPPLRSRLATATGFLPMNAPRFFVSPGKLSLLAIGLLLAGSVGAESARFASAVKARIEKGYAVVQFADGTRTMVPMASLPDEDRAFLTVLSDQSPLAHGKSEVVVAKETFNVKRTIQVATVVGPLETVQLCPPSVPRNQLGATCMLYGRVHWLDIAGYPLDNASIYRISNNVSPDCPWADPRYMQGLATLTSTGKPPPLIHTLPPQEEDPFEWARGELRQGRPILAAFPREIWQALPPGFVAAHPWNGGSVGHQIVINGFTWNQATKQGTFHIINSWEELLEFDLKTEAAQGGALVIEQSLSPRGEMPAPTAREVVKTITFLRVAGKTNLYEVETNLGKRRVAAASEDGARALVENAK